MKLPAAMRINLDTMFDVWDMTRITQRNLLSDGLLKTDRLELIIMALSNTAVPKYYGMFRDAVIRGEIPVCKEISMEMNRVDDLIANPGIYYDDRSLWHD